MLCSAFHVRAFLTLMSFYDELIQEQMYLKSFSTCNLLPSSVFKTIDSGVLTAITLVFLGIQKKSYFFALRLYP